MVIEALSDGAMPDSYRAVDALLQRVLCRPGAQARDLAALTGLITAAGLSVAAVAGLASGHSLLVCCLPDTPAGPRSADSAPGAQ